MPVIVHGYVEVTRVVETWLSVIGLLWITFRFLSIGRCERPTPDHVVVLLRFTGILSGLS